MNIKYFLKRFNDLYYKHSREINGEKGGNILIYSHILIRYGFSFLLFGTSIKEYFIYKFYKKSLLGQREYITTRKYKKIQKLCNQNKEASNYCHDKRLFNKKFHEFIGRRWIDVDKASLNEVIQFIASSSDSIFIKVSNGYGGQNIQEKRKDNIDIKELYNSLRNKHNYILEDKILQKGALHEFNPSSVKTIRITTIYNPNTGKVNFMKANLRMGVKNSSVDNLHSGGICVPIDVDTGIIYQGGYDQTNNLYLVHPSSLKQIVGFKIPYWEDCKEYIRKAAKMLPEVKYVGWDVVANGDGSFCLIEANDKADHDIQQLNDKGLWPDYKKVLKTFKE